MAGASASFGTLVQVVDNVDSNLFHTISGVKDISGPNTSVDKTETTSHSTSIAHKSYIPTLIDDGTIDFEINFDPTDPTHSLVSPYGLENLFQNRTTTAFRLIPPGETGVQFTGYVETFGQDYPVSGVKGRKVSIRISGAPVEIGTATNTFSGFVLSSTDGSPIVGASIAFSVGGSGSVLSDANGFYTGTITAGSTGTATPTKSGKTFAPVNRAYTAIAADMRNQNFIGS